MNPKYVLTMVFLLVKMSLWSQFGAGGSLGITQNTTTTNTKPFNSREQSLPGTYANLFATYDINNWLTFQSDLEYIQKNTKLERGGFYEGIYTSTYYDFIQLPITSRFRLATGKFQAFINVGGFLGYCLGGKTKGITANMIHSLESPNSNSKIIDLFNAEGFNTRFKMNKIDHNRFEAGYVIGAGLQHQVTSNNWIFCQIRYYYDITNQYKEAGVFPLRSYNQTVQISLGTSFKLSK